MIKQKFIKPTSKEVYDNMVEKQFEYAETESQKFINFFESKGWKVGKTPMKEWDKAVSMWITNYYETTPLKNQKSKIITESLESNKYSDWNEIYEQYKQYKL
jgi:hypothetical protein